MEKLSLKTKISMIRESLSKEMNKSGKNSYSNYSYFQLKDFMPRALELFNEQGIYTEFWVGRDKYLMPGKKITNYITDEKGVQVVSSVIEEENWEWKEFAHLLVVNLEDEEDTIELTKETANVQLQAAQPIQNLGGKSTYMKRYMYMDLLEINENDAVEEETGKPVKVEPKTTTRATKKPVVQTVTTKVEEPTPVVEAPSTFETLPEPPSVDDAPVVDATALMTMETKLALANRIKELGGDPRTEIVEIAKELNTDVPLLKESDKDKILEMINSKKR